MVDFISRKPVIPENQLARRIQAKSIRDLGAEPSAGGVGGKAPTKRGGLAGRSPLEMKNVPSSSNNQVSTVVNLKKLN